MRCGVSRLLAAWCLFLSSLSVAHAQRRVALVIGNAAYASVEALPNPVRDTTLVAAMLTAAKFDVVDVRTNLGGEPFRAALREFGDKAAEADIAVVYYAGHGIEVAGTNYLIPTNARLARDTDVEDEAIPLDRVLRALEPARQLRLVILDACRDNPFIPRMRRLGASRSIGRGLAKVEPEAGDTLVAYATRAGDTALDGDTNSPFAVALAKHLMTPGLDIRLALGRVRDEVRTLTGRRQEPFYTGSLGGATVTLLPATAPAPEPSGADADMLALVAGTSDRTLLTRLAGGPSPTIRRAAAARLAVLDAPALALTIKPGLTSAQVADQLRATGSLSESLDGAPREGALMPGTYHVAPGTARAAVLAALERAADRSLAEAWDGRDPALPLRSPKELLTLASLVQAMQGQPDELPRIAAVYVNRLNKRMRLQSDATIVYGLVGGRGTLGRAILRSEIEQATPYNTYVIEGLPPGPIGNPGREALEAAAHPARSQDLYIVPDGNGRHLFAATLDEHRQNVARWREALRSREGPPPAR